MTGKTRRRAITQIKNVTAFLGASFEPTVATLGIEDGRIVDIVAGGGSRTGVSDSAADDGVLDGAGMLAFPGMIDCHDHLRDLTPGLSVAEGLNLDAYLRVGWDIQSKMGVTEYRIGTLLGSAQRLKAGITTVCDHCYPYHTDGLESAAIEAYQQSGVRWTYARGIMTRPYEPICESWTTAAHRIRHLLESGLVTKERLFVAPVSIRQACPDDYRSARELAEQLDCGLYTHVAETVQECEAWLQECGTTPIRALDKLAFLTPRTVLVHCVLLEPDEIELLAERGCHVIHCPTNHMKLAKGFTPVPDLLSAGVNVALGVDKMSDMLTEMRAEMGMHAAFRGDAAAIRKRDAMEMATVRGARALWPDQAIGTIDVGQVADIVLFDAQSLLQAPLIDPTYTLLYRTHPGMVRQVVIDGEVVVDDGRLVDIDEEALRQEAESVAEHYLRRLDLE